MNIYLIRHCKAEGQAPDAPLTALGRSQAEELADFLHDRKIQAIVCSPFERAIQSIQPLAQRLGLNIAKDDRLAEKSIVPRESYGVA